MLSQHASIPPLAPRFIPELGYGVPYPSVLGLLLLLAHAASPRAPARRAWELWRLNTSVVYKARERFRCAAQESVHGCDPAAPKFPVAALDVTLARPIKNSLRAFSFGGFTWLRKCPNLTPVTLHLSRHLNIPGRPLWARVQDAGGPHWSNLGSSLGTIKSRRVSTCESQVPNLGLRILQNAKQVRGVRGIEQKMNRRSAVMLAALQCTASTSN